MKAEPSIMDLKPADTPEYMLPAWASCVSWAAGEPEVVEAFRRDTGNNWQPGRNGIERMIDKATGVEWDFVKAFVLWVNANVWGPIDGPDDPQSGRRGGEQA